MFASGPSPADTYQLCLKLVSLRLPPWVASAQPAITLIGKTYRTSAGAEGPSKFVSHTRGLAVTSLALVWRWSGMPRVWCSSDVDLALVCHSSNAGLGLV